jgi:FG-GAP-like repeat/ASPIC and UnbV/PPIC-type PPIASE domain
VISQWFGFAGESVQAAPKLARILAVVLVMSIVLGAPPFAQTSPAAKSAATDEVFLEVIVVPSPEEAQQVLDLLKKGADFSQLAKIKSIDPTADAGGFMGKVSPSALRAELRDALNGVGPGQITPVVHTPSGYTILKVVAKGAAPSTNDTDPARNFAMVATGTVKYVADVGGLGEAEASLKTYPKPSPTWNEDPLTVCNLRQESLMVESLTEMLAPGSPDAQHREPIDTMETHYALAQLYAYQGKMEPAVAEYQASYQMALSAVPAAIPQMSEALGVIYLHKSEIENDVYRAPGEKCLFPMRPGNAYPHPEDSRKSVEYFLKYLELKPDELEVRWLLNLAYMTLGQYPAQVPQKYLIPPSAFESKEDVGRFVDVAFEIGLGSFGMAGGLIVDDFENNGLLDVVTSSFGSCGMMRYFHNNGDGTFTDRTEKAGLSAQVGGLNIIQTDYNNDGCLDILALRGGWEFPQRKSLLRNNCDGTFTDVTVESGLASPATSSQAAVWADINNDGWLDLFVGNENGPPQLFLNNGDGTFKDISTSAGVNQDGASFSKGVAAADYDNDGYVDLYVSNLSGTNLLFHNNHDNTFTQVAHKAGVGGTGKGFATWFFDYDNDGLPDLFVTSYFVSVDETMRTYLGYPLNAGTMKLYKNLGNGKFRDVTAETGLDKVFMPMGANFGDIDNDGYLDIYLGTGNPSYASEVPNVLLRNHDGKYFADVTASSGTGELHKGHGVAFADLANNGKEDIVTVIGGATPGDSHALRVFKNPGNNNDWITVKLVGVKTNRAAIGARIKATVENDGQPAHSIYRTVGSGGSFGSSPLQQHIGLGKSARIVSIEVFWPVSKTHQVFSGVEKNQFIEIKEFASEYTKLDRKPFPLPEPKSKAEAAFQPPSGNTGVKD